VEDLGHGPRVAVGHGLWAAGQGARGADPGALPS